jgi:hypothetical protein
MLAAISDRANVTPKPLFVVYSRPTQPAAIPNRCTRASAESGGQSGGAAERTVYSSETGVRQPQRRRALANNPKITIRSEALCAELRERHAIGIFQNGALPVA